MTREERAAALIAQALELLSEKSDDMLRVLSYGDVAGRLGVSEMSVRRWVKSGQLYSIPLGGKRGVPARALAEFIERGGAETCRTSATPEPLPNGTVRHMKPRKHA